MATPKEQAQAQVRRLESELSSAEALLQMYKKTEKADKERGFDKVGPAESAVKNAQRALDIAKADLRRLS